MHYEEALKLDQHDVVIRCNLAAAKLKIGNYSEAAEVAEAAVLESGGFSPKALYRKGQAMEGLNRLADAVDAYTAAVALKPDDPFVKQRLLECKERMPANGRLP